MDSNYDLRTLIDGVEANAASFNEYRAESRNPIPLIYQSGYLTIKEYDPRFKTYQLAFPNDEARYGFMNFLLPFYSNIPDNEQDFYIGKFVHELVYQIENSLVMPLCLVIQFVRYIGKEGLKAG